MAAKKLMRNMLIGLLSSSMFLVHGSAVSAESAPAKAATKSKAKQVSAPTREVGSYYTSWSAEKGFRLKHLDQSGVAAKFTFLNYSFENVYKMEDGTYRCDNGRDLEDEGKALGMKGSLDYANHFTAAESVDGTADSADQALAGNFNQLKQLKVKHPDLKMLVVLGGWSWSRWFSAAAATDDLRRTLVSSCIDLYIKGNLPMLKGHGGKGAAANVFDGIDVDWEFPGVQGESYNTVSPDDKRNFTLLMAEFRSQLNAMTKENGKKYYLTVAVNSTRGHMDHTEPAEYTKSLDWVSLMTYDFHGNWEKTGPANFQSNLYGDPTSPDGGKNNIDSAVKNMLELGVPASKIVVGVPFYARGWSGVPAANNGLYQTAAAPAKGIEEGVEFYSTLAARKLTRFYHPVTKQLWTYDDGTFWSYDDPKVIRTKVAYVRKHKLGGIMSWALDQDDAKFTLSKEMAKAR